MRLRDTKEKVVQGSTQYMVKGKTYFEMDSNGRVKLDLLDTLPEDDRKYAKDRTFLMVQRYRDWLKNRPLETIICCGE